MACIRKIVEKKLCHGCGSCVAVCPTECITLHLGSQGIYEPIVNSDKCTGCGLCLAVCSGKGMDYDDTVDKIFHERPSNRYIGYYKDLMLLSAKDPDILNMASSGGVITRLLLHLYDTGIISGAIVARSNPKNPWLNETVIARDRESILGAAGSRYSPTATNAVLKALMNNHDDKKYAYVGLPCQIASLRLIEQQNPALTNKILLRIGLFCGKMTSVHGTRHLLSRYGLKPESLKILHYREGKWPGYLMARNRNLTVKIPYFQYYGLFFMHGLFTPYRCLCCNDFHADLSDFSCGDAWLSELKAKRSGKNLAIVKTQTALDIVSEMTEVGHLECDKATEEMFETAYKRNHFIKKDSLLSRLQYLDRMKKPVPDIGDSTLSFLGRSDRDMINLFHSTYTNTRFFTKFGKFLPIIFFRLYYRLTDVLLGRI